MRNILIASAAILGLLGSTMAMADEFIGQQNQAVAASVEQQATDASMADPTAPSSLRSHGHP